ncbi:hypothetical protein NC651_039163 [Populus alba x Populus x berolinensis]|nr:hypothetical protein NC651_039163 [Populus alba x Populus x berolinensis]
MKFGWLDLFASRMSSYLNVLFTCPWIMYGCFDMFLWSFLSCHYFFFLSCNEVLGNIFHA